MKYKNVLYFYYFLIENGKFSIEKYNKNKNCICNEEFSGGSLELCINFVEIHYDEVPNERKVTLSISKCF